VLGTVGEVDELVTAGLTNVAPRRLGVIDLDLDALFGAVADASLDQFVSVPSRFPSASIDLAFVVPDDVHAGDLATVLRGASELVQDVSLFDVYRGEHVSAGTRSLAYAVRLGASDRTLGEKEVAEARGALVAAAAAQGATLRG